MIDQQYRPFVLTVVCVFLVFHLYDGFIRRKLTANGRRAGEDEHIYNSVGSVTKRLHDLASMQSIVLDAAGGRLLDPVGDRFTLEVLLQGYEEAGDRQPLVGAIRDEHT